MSNATDTRRKLEAARRDGIKRIDARIAAGEVKTPQGEPLGAIRARLVARYEAAFGPYTGKSPRHTKPAAPSTSAAAPAA